MWNTEKILIQIFMISQDKQLLSVIILNQNIRFIKNIHILLSRYLLILFLPYINI